ncbi:MAG: ABC transporter permease [Rickettsiaceae bacterium]|nr:ABC transporter permease [Rickettsiaceae bacterium]
MRILKALIKKEIFQIFRDPSSIMIAFVLPLLLLFIFGYGISLDANRIKVGLVIEDKSADVSSLIKAFENSKFIQIFPTYDKRDLQYLLDAGRLRGIVVIPENFTSNGASEYLNPEIQVIGDGAEPNTASFMQSYVEGVIRVWMVHEEFDREGQTSEPLISVEPRFWFNPELKSRNFLIPGSISIIMTLIGTLLTALVIAREWERGTMEAMLATPVTIKQIILGKLIPYFALGICSMFVCFIVATIWYDVPFRGSMFALLLSTSIFLIAALGQGFFISSIARDQFVASQAALLSAFLPSFMLSGFIFEISAMPAPIRAITYIFPARYFVTILQTLFLTGNIWSILFESAIMILIIAAVFFRLTAKKNVKRLDI